MLRYRDFPLLAALCIAAYFVLLTWSGLTMYFAPDDMQNMYTYWKVGAGGVIGANLLFATSFYRPMAGLFYLPLLKLFAFNPLPYRIAIFVLLCVNVWMLYCFARRLSGSRETGAFAALIGCFHASALGVYLSTAMIYEVLCFGFLVGALWWYVRMRENGRELNGRELLVFAILFACALNSKEMAVVLPALLMVYEILYQGWRRRPWREVAPVAIAGVMAALYVCGKLFGADSLTSIPAYRPVYTLDRYLQTTTKYVADLFMLDQPVSATVAIAFWLGLFVLAAVFRRRNMVFGAAFAFLVYLPLNFVPARQGFVLYIPLAGFAIYAADLVVWLLDLFRWNVDYRRQLSALVFITAMVVLGFVNTRNPDEAGAIRHAQSITWHVLEEFKRIHPHAKRGGRLLLVDSPIDNSWDLYFIAKLYFDDRSLNVAWTRPRRGDAAIYGDVHENFDHELRYVDGHFTQPR